MEHIFILSKETKKTLPFWLFYLFQNKWFLKKEWMLEKERQVLCIPIPSGLSEKQKIRYITKIGAVLKKQGIRDVYLDHTIDKDVLKMVKQNFSLFRGSELFYGCFLKILKAFLNKKGYKPEECELIFISNNPKKAREYLLKCHKFVKKISIFTTTPALFQSLFQEFKETYGMFLELKGKNDTIKKYKTVYVNLEEERILKKDFFKKGFLLDIYGIYQNAYQTILFSLNKTKETEEKKKSLVRCEYELKYTENGGKKRFCELLENEKQCKIINITKI